MGMATAIPFICCLDAFSEVQAGEKEVPYESTVLTETVLLLACWPRRGQQQPRLQAPAAFPKLCFSLPSREINLQRAWKEMQQRVKGKHQLEGGAVCSLSTELCAPLMELERWVQGNTVQYTDTAAQVVGTPFQVLGKLHRLTGCSTDPGSDAVDLYHWFPSELSCFLMLLPLQSTSGQSKASSSTLLTWAGFSHLLSVREWVPQVVSSTQESCSSISSGISGVDCSSSLLCLLAWHFTKSTVELTLVKQILATALLFQVVISACS